MKRVALVFSMIFAAASLFAQADMQILATVKYNKPEQIYLKELRTRVEAYQKQTGTASFTIDQKKEILDAMIDERLVVQAAQKAGITIPESQVTDYFLQSVASQLGLAKVTEQELDKIIREQTKMSLDDMMRQQAGMSVKDYKAYLKSQLIAQQYIIGQKGDMIRSAAPSDVEIRNYFELNKAQFVRSDLLKIFLVRVPKGSDPSKAEKTATALYNDYKAKKVSADQMAQNSRKDNSGYEAGTLFIGKNEQQAQMLGFRYADFLALFERPLNSVSELNTTDVDYQFYAVLAKYESKMLGLSDGVQPESTVTVYEYIRNALTQQKQAMAFAQASQDITTSLNKPEYVERKKTGKDLEKLLNW